ncbi:uncharacterized protein LOC110184776 [Drosophila serrata]|uniref:uncharacterized protein LOC110184776 n=1 Tax=Drosophila serrata TaxID=7274 RepID=UPI000A1D21E7|nr:uncharacterized protein LOC110184776 [Drosophila serrata]
MIFSTLFERVFHSAPNHRQANTKTIMNFFPMLVLLAACLLIRVNGSQNSASLPTSGLAPTRRDYFSDKSPKSDYYSRGSPKSDYSSDKPPKSDFFFLPEEVLKLLAGR